ncbi:MAG: hypothetical protein AB2L14_04260 [Candidatus Xenobiia bacterium LiM19]
MRKHEKTITVAVLFALIAVLCSAALQAADGKSEPVARISVLNGKVENAGTKRIYKLFDAIYEGDTLNIAGNAYVRLIFFKDYHEEELDGLCTARIERSGIKLLKGLASMKKTTRDVYKVNLAENRAARGKEIAGGASRIQFLKPAKYNIYPVSNILELPEKLTFSWNTPDCEKINFYRVTFGRLDDTMPDDRTIPDDRRKTALYTTVISGTSLTLPGRVKPPEEGKAYYLTVEGFLQDPKLPGSDFAESRIAASEPGYVFTVPSPVVVQYIHQLEAQCQKLKKGSDEWKSQSLLLFSLYLGYGGDKKTARLYREFTEYGTDNDLTRDNEYLDGLMKTYDR